MTARAAMERCYLAWQRTEMQLPFELDEAPAPRAHTPLTGGGGLVEPERGLTTGAEPCCDPLSGRSDGDPVAAPPATSGGSAPSPPPER